MNANTNSLHEQNSIEVIDTKGRYFGDYYAGEVYYYVPRYKEGDKFCEFCGKELSKKVTGTTFDPETGKQVIHYMLGCWNWITEKCLWWTYRKNLGCGGEWKRRRGK